MWIEVQGALGALDAWILLGGTDFELGADSDDLNGSSPGWKARVIPRFSRCNHSTPSKDSQQKLCVSWEDRHSLHAARSKYTMTMIGRDVVLQVFWRKDVLRCKNFRIFVLAEALRLQFQMRQETR